MSPQQHEITPVRLLLGTPARCHQCGGVFRRANLYSLIETAQANGIESYRYLKQVFEQLSVATCLADIEALLPWRVASQGRTVQDGVG
jgi:hypothetical protein